MNYALIDTAGAILRTQEFDGPAPQLAAEKGLRWAPADPPAHDPATQRPPQPVLPATGAAVEYVVEDIPIEELRAAKIAAAEARARDLRDRIVAGISPAEMATWSIKRAEALAYTATGNTADAPGLDLEAQARGVPLATFVHKVLTKAAQLSALEAAIAGRCGAIQDAARAATTAAQIAAIDVEAGWPA